MNLNFKELLKQHINQNERVFEVNFKNLTEPGENYCSDMYQVDLLLENMESHSKRPLYIVVKRKQTKVVSGLEGFASYQFDKEISFYHDIVPTLEQFQLENNVGKFDIFPEFFSARRNVNGVGEEIDEFSLIILENLKMQGYSNIDRLTGFDLEGAKLILKDLAAFHAVPLALKIKKPKLFQTKIKIHFKPPPNFPDHMTMRAFISDAWIDAILNQEQCKPYQDLLKKKLEKEFESLDIFFRKCVVEPYATIVHADIWTNNTMQISDNGKLLKNKFIDFQSYLYGSPFCDVIFFIWSSIKYSVIEKHHEELLKYYYSHFAKILEDFGCYTSEFKYQNFLQHLDEAASIEFLHILYFANLVYIEKGEITFQMSNDVGEMIVAKSLTRETKERIENVVAHFGKRGWIKL